MYKKQNKTNLNNMCKIPPSPEGSSPSLFCIAEFIDVKFFIPRKLIIMKGQNK